MIGVSPGRLELNFAQTGASAQIVFLKNLENREIRVSIGAEKYARYLEITPEKITLPATGEKQVSVAAKNGKNFSTNLEIVAYETSDIATGIKIPLTVTGNNFFAQHQYVFILTAAFFITAFVYVLNQKIRR